MSYGSVCRPTLSFVLVLWSLRLTRRAGWVRDAHPVFECLQFEDAASLSLSVGLKGWLCVYLKWLTWLGWTERGTFFDLGFSRVLGEGACSLAVGDLKIQPYLLYSPVGSLEGGLFLSAWVRRTRSERGCVFLVLVGRGGWGSIGLPVCDWVGWFAVARLVFSVWLSCGGLERAVCFFALFLLCAFKGLGVVFSLLFCLGELWVGLVSSVF